MMDSSVRIPPQGAGFTENELAYQPVEVLSGYSDPIISLAEREANAARRIGVDGKLSEGEEAYFASRGADITGLFAEMGRDIAPDGTIGYRTIGGRIVSGADFVCGFARGDIVQLKSGGPRMTIFDRHWEHMVHCRWFVAGEYKGEKFDTATLRYLGRPEDLPPETPARVISLNEHRETLISRGNASIAAKPKRVPKRRAA